MSDAINKPIPIPIVLTIRLDAFLNEDPKAAQKIHTDDLSIIRRFREEVEKNPVALSHILRHHALLHVLKNLEFNALFKRCKLKDSIEVMLGLAAQCPPDVADFVSAMLNDTAAAPVELDQSDRMQKSYDFLEDVYYNFALHHCTIEALTAVEG